MAGSAWSNQAVIAALVDIIAGTPGSGLFVYSGPPRSGNLIASIASTSGTDPFGNNYIPGFGSYDAFGDTGQLTGANLAMFAGVNQTVKLGPGGLTIFNSHGATIFSLDETRDGFFLYADTGSAAQGALLASMVNAGGNDSFGNLALVGLTEYFKSGATFFAVSLAAGGVNFWHAASGAGPWTSDGALTDIQNLGATQTLQIDTSLFIATTGTPSTTSQLEVNGAITGTSGDIIAANGKLRGGGVDVLGAGNGLAVAEGSNAKQGTATLSAGTKVVSNTSVTANSRIMLTAQDNNSTGALRVSARTAGTSFTITSSNAADSGVVAFEIFEPG